MNESWIQYQLQNNPELTYDDISTLVNKVKKINPDLDISNMSIDDIKEQISNQNVIQQPIEENVEQPVENESVDNINENQEQNVQVEPEKKDKSVEVGQNVQDNVQDNNIPFNPKPVGHHVTQPIQVYSQNKEKGNVWIRQSGDEDNKDRVCMLQFSNSLFIDSERTLMDEYYDKLYEVREGYDRPKDFWEIPMWQSNIKATVPNADSYTVRDMEEAKKFLENSNYKQYLFSVLDVNKNNVKELASTGKNIGIGGYTDMSFFDGMPNVKIYEDVKGLANDMGLEYKAGSDYNMFKGTKTIPRLQMSTGCKHHCAFCCIPNTVIDKPREYIADQVKSMRDLDAKLIYIDDKTFGQAGSYKFLRDMYQYVKQHNLDFEGFIIQTTASMMRKLTAEFLVEAGVKYIELGIESYNDAILRKYKKPATEKIIDEAVEKIRNAGIRFIPNLIIGFPEETVDTYKHTIEFLKKNEDIISHFNVYNLAVYKGTDLQEMLDAKYDDFDDSNENNIDKSWYKGTDIHQKFNDYIYSYGMKLLDKTPYADRRETKVSILKRTLVKYIFE